MEIICGKVKKVRAPGQRVYTALPMELKPSLGGTGVAQGSATAELGAAPTLPLWELIVEGKAMGAASQVNMDNHMQGVVLRLKTRTPQSKPAVSHPHLP